ncbi:MAG: RHS repeat-associated core domain-containing protein [Candidatus Contendobacter sp.]|nr:RHS repeat-associated core domain-containing protein [Candidatus Contendobacter sp.]
MTQPLRPWLRIAGLLLVLAGILIGAAHADVITYFHNDPSGSPVAATDANGRLLWKETYRPYGERLLNGASPDTNRLWFTGKPQDPDTGLSYLGARYYSPQLGRFMGIDPKAVDPGDPHSFNRYAYANNNPYKYVDPDGKHALAVVVVGLALWVGTEALPTSAVPAGSGEVTPTTLPDLGLLGATKGLVGVAAMTIRSVEKAAAKEGAEVAAKTGANALYHYTDEAGARGIAESGVVRADSKGRVFLTTDEVSPSNASDELFMGRGGTKGTHRVEIELEDGAGLTTEGATQPNELIHRGSIRDGRNATIRVKENDF